MPESRIAQFATDPFLMDFATGACINGSQPIQQLIAPIVEVPDLTFHFKTFKRDSRLILPSTLRQLGGKVTQIAASLNDTMGTLDINSADGAPLDNNLNDDALKFWIADAMSMLADIRSQVTESQAIKTAIASVTATTPVQWTNVEVDPVKAIDAQILALMKQARSNGAAVAFGPGAWDVFKNNPKVLEHTKGNLSWDTNPSLFHANAQFQTCYSIQENALLAQDANASFMFPPNSVLIFARTANPSRRDPSYMKTFSIVKERINFRLTDSADGRSVRVQLDFPQKVTVTNTVGANLLNVTDGPNL